MYDNVALAIVRANQSMTTMIQTMTELYSHIDFDNEAGFQSLSYI